MFDSRPPTPPRVRKGPGERLRTALAELCEGHGTIITHRDKSWASITFAGARHHIEFAFDGAEAVAAG